MRVLMRYFWCSVALAVTGSGAGYVLWDLCASSWAWRDVAIFGGACFLMVSGITVGYHRFVTHRSFEFSFVGAWLARPFLLWGGCLAWQNPPLWWGAVHAAHHADADGERDPHSPVSRRHGFFRRIGQVLYAHMLWVPRVRPDIERFCARIHASRLERFYERWYIVIGPLSGLALAYALGGLGGVSWYLAAVFMVWHLTASINSLTHLRSLWGYRRFATTDESTNLWFLALLTLGEALHSNHHAFPRSARFAHAWWEYALDIGYLEIVLLRVCGLVRVVHVPAPARLALKQPGIP